MRAAQCSLNIKSLLAHLTQKESLDDRVTKAMAQLAEQVVDDVVEMACKLAKHRNSKTLEKGDIRLAFEKTYKQKIPTKLHGAKGSGITII